MSLKQQIEEQQARVWRHRMLLEDEQQRLRNLEAQRVDCKHEFSKSLKGYEHEGGECIHCGVNELYAATLAAQKKG